MKDQFNPSFKVQYMEKKHNFQHFAELPPIKHKSRLKYYSSEKYSNPDDDSMKFHNEMSQYLMSEQTPSNSISSLSFEIRKANPEALNMSFHERIDNELYHAKFSETKFKSLKSLILLKPREETDDTELLQGYMRIREWTKFEEIEAINTKNPFSDTRKAFLRIKWALIELCRKIVKSSIFDAIILCFIIANTVIIAIEDPDTSDESSILNNLDDIFLYVYTAEFGLKIIAYGVVISKGSYFRDPWNIFDFIILVTAWLANIYSSSFNFNALRSLRILRPLKSISSLKDLRILVSALFQSIVPIANALMMLFFVLLIYAIIGNQLFGGLFKYKCMDLETGKFPSAPGSDSVCGDLGCPDGFVCVKSLDNPVYGKINYDNVLIGALQCFTSVSLEGWSTIMKIGEKTLNKPTSIIFSITLIFIGAFMMLNIMEVILISNLSKEMDKSRAKQKERDLIEEELADSSVLDNLIQISEEDDENWKESFEFKYNNSENSKKYRGYTDSSLIRDSFKTSVRANIIKPPYRMHEIFKNAEIIVRNSNFTDRYELIDSSENMSEQNQEGNITPNESLPTPVFDWENYKHRTSSIQTNHEYKSIDALKQDISGKFADNSWLDFEKINKHTSFRYQIPSTNVYDKKDNEGGNKSSLISWATPRTTARIKNLKLRKDLLGKLRDVNDKTKIKAFIEESYEIHSNSFIDVIPVINKSSYSKPSNKYRFSYRNNKDISSSIESLTQSWDNKVSDTIMRYREKGDRFDVFKYLCQKHKMKAAFHMTAIKVPKIIKKIKDNDFSARNIVGDWSGFDVNSKSKINKSIDIVENMNFRIWRRGIFGIWNQLTFPLFLLAGSKYFNYFMIFCIIGNTTVLSVNYYGIDSDTSLILNQINTVFTIIFVCEMGIKILGLGLINYCKEKINLFDASITILGLVDFLLITGSGSVISAIWAIRVFRIFRVVRVARLFRYLQTTTHIIDKISKNIYMFFYLTIFLSLFVIIFTILGVQLFSNKLDFAEAHNQYNYNNLYFSFLSTFQILTDENWNNEEYLTMRSSYGYPGTLFPAVWLMLGNEILLNIFLALVLDIFSVEDENSESSSLDGKSGLTSKNGLFESRSRKKKEKRLKALEEAINGDFEFDENISLEEIKRQSMLKKQTSYFTGIECRNSFFIFSKENKFRKICYFLSSNPTMEKCILAIILVSTLKLIWDTYLLDFPSTDIRIEISNNLDTAFTCIFAFEMIIKSVSMGFILSKGSYLRDRWCQLDFIIVIFSIVDLALTDISWPEIKVLRILRILRPLRIISHNVQMKIMLNALIESLIGVINVFGAILILWLVFSILGVSLFAGKLYSCSKSNINNRNECENYGYNWDAYHFNFDNVIEAMVDSFILTTQESWPDYMYAACSAYKDGYAPISNYYPNAAIYFIVHLCLSSVFFMNLFSGVVFEKFIEAKKNESSLASLILSKEQMVWVEIQSLITQSKPELDIASKPKNRFQALFFIIQNHWIFESFIILCIILNFFLMCLYYDQASTRYTDSLEVCNMIFTYIFIGEGAIKLIGLGKNYFKDGWNRFDFFVVISSCVDLVFSYMTVSIDHVWSKAPQLIRAIRVLRVTRVVRLIKKFKTLQDLITLVSYSIPSILNVSAILLLVYVIYAVLGVYLFHSINSGAVFDDYSNMSNFDQALVKLFKHSTGENWPDAMYDCADSVGKTVSYIYWISFIAFTTFIMINLFVMVILQDYEDFANDAESGVILFNKDVKKFKNAWAVYSAESHGKRIHYKFLVDFMLALGDGLGAPYGFTHGQVLKILSTLDLDIDADGYIYYNDMLYSVMKRKYERGIDAILDENSEKLLRKEESSTTKKLRAIRDKSSMDFYSFDKISELKNKGKTNLFLSMIYTRTVLRAWNNWTRRKKAKGNASISITPRMSDEDFPGENSLMSEIE
ncbi:SCN4A_4 [Blepharisma stoltei]|uniref:Ion transport domain-containing protein n=1 Tax=Blepharisma stoltei TaxID=1481888 RepID=A0AAU9ILQ4_9CILI|nr:unnamed protein product [Blepharisma stoltei]